MQPLRAQLEQLDGPYQRAIREERDRGRVEPGLLTLTRHLRLHQIKILFEKICELMPDSLEQSKIVL